MDLSSWETLAQDLQEQGGYVQLPLSEEQQQIFAQGFQLGRLVLEKSVSRSSSTTGTSNKVRCIGPTDDSAHATGYHPAASSNSMSRYNFFREGFVFSDGAMCFVEDEPDFELAMTQMQTCLHEIANQAVEALEQQMQLPRGWFQEQFQYQQNYSQWHLKRYVGLSEAEGNDLDIISEEKKQQKQQSTEEKKMDEEEEEKILLPSHTDPSLLSVVILDRPGKNTGAMGLQHHQKVVEGDNIKRVWKELPFHGHAVATIFVGSVLSHVTGARCAAVKHRVIQQPDAQDRMAATFFLRPSGDALLCVPPSPVLEGVSLKKQTTFDTWSARVSRHYMKNKQQLNKTDRKTATKNSSDSTLNEQPTSPFRDDYTEISLHGMYDPDDPTCTKLTGREKYLGGELGANGKIYCIPGHAEQVLVIDPSTEPPTVKHIGPRYKGEFKWLRAVRTSTGIILGLPCHADSILRIDPTTDQVSTIEWDASDPQAPPLGMPWKYHGGNISKMDGCLYLIPQRAEHILKIDTKTEKVSFFGGPFPGKNKFYGGLVGKRDDCIYGICQNATGILRIDPSNQTASLHGDFPAGGWKWHGGVHHEESDQIFCIPAHADTILKIEPGNPPQLTTFGKCRTGQHRSDGKYKYLGGAVGCDNNVYFFPSDSDYVLQINPRTNEVKEVGPNLRDIEKIHNNKWQNGFASKKDGCIYGIPLKASSIIRVRPSIDGKEVDVTTIGGPFPGLNHWEGGVMAEDGAMYCMPLNSSEVLRIKTNLLKST